MKKARRPSRPWSAVPWLTSVVLFLLAAVTSGAQPADDEYRVKATFIFHFAQLIDWPAETQSGVDNSFFLCTFGEDPFRGELEGTVEGKVIGTRVLRIHHLKHTEDMRGCRIVFLGKAESTRIPALLTNLQDAPVLTVGETPGFLGAGGMICFVLEGNKIRFGINLDAASAAKLKIGSRLLILAQTVIGESQ